MKPSVPLKTRLLPPPLEQKGSLLPPILALLGQVCSQGCVHLISSPVQAWVCTLGHIFGKDKWLWEITPSCAAPTKLKRLSHPFQPLCLLCCLHPSHAEVPHCFGDCAVVFILTNDIIIEKSQTINPVRCCHAFLIRKLEYGFKRPRAGGRVK